MKSSSKDAQFSLTHCAGCKKAEGCPNFSVRPTAGCVSGDPISVAEQVRNTQ